MFSSHTCWWKERSGQIMRVGEPREHTWSWRTAEQIKFSIHIQFMWVQVHLLLWDKVNLRIQYNIMTGVCVYILKSTIYSFNEGKWLIWSLMYESLQSILVYSCTSLTLKATSYKRKETSRRFMHYFMVSENLLSSSADDGRSARRFEHALHTICLASDMSTEDISKH